MQVRRHPGAFDTRGYEMEFNVPTIVTHSLVGAAAAAVAAPRENARRFWLLALACPALPDADMIAFRFGIRYGSFFGHRGFAHSLVFAALLGLAAAWVMAIGGGRRWREVWQWRQFLFFFAITASHGLLDALTDGGMGVALLSPFTQKRFFFPWTPIAVSPFGWRWLLQSGERGVLWSELKWVWGPALLLAGILRPVNLRRIRNLRIRQ